MYSIKKFFHPNCDLFILIHLFDNELRMLSYSRPAMLQTLFLMKDDIALNFRQEKNYAKPKKQFIRLLG